MKLTAFYCERYMPRGGGSAANRRRNRVRYTVRLVCAADRAEAERLFTEATRHGDAGRSVMCRPVRESELDFWEKHPGARPDLLPHV